MLRGILKVFVVDLFSVRVQTIFCFTLFFTLMYETFFEVASLFFIKNNSVYADLINPMYGKSTNNSE